MVLIQSEQGDLMTDRVIEWLYYYGVKEIVRINENTNITIESVTLDKIIISLDSKTNIDLNEVSFFWYSRGSLNCLLEQFLNHDLDNKLKNKIGRFLQYEWQKLREYLYYELNSKPSLGNYYKSATNKLINLKIAEQCGLKIPEFIVSGKNNHLINFGRTHCVINKPIGENMSLYYKDGYFNMLTKEVHVDRCIANDAESFPTLLQRLIKKEYEIRTFILRDKLFSMAIYSQKNDLTSVDYRNYDFNHMNRMVPYQLPKEMEQRLLLFMQKAELDTGSVDLIKSTDGDYYFLEVNPAGNIEMVTDTCNYFIEKSIAKLIVDERK